MQQRVEDECASNQCFSHLVIHFQKDINNLYPINNLIFVYNIIIKHIFTIISYRGTRSLPHSKIRFPTRALFGMEAFSSALHKAVNISNNIIYEELEWSI